ncbi:ABC transporter ATP-binding protein [Chitinimonas sp. BJYL2]|uniref:ABC transporter ATP-binding protein n=1 Tax=Chitinimonas sp. BJYL2 TaxID=2976696 RepID=UPI0022B3B8D4|nr:ABC transporter ATP-binding protein [Chitinimonas sp. BJYL2]
MNRAAQHEIAPPAFQLRSLGLQLGRKTLLSHIDTSLPGGAITALVGPNGAGKSTLLRLLAGLQSPSSGAVRLGDGHAVDRLDPQQRARRIGWLGQFLPDDLPLSLRDVVLLGRRPMLGGQGNPDAADHARVDAALAKFDLTDLADRRWQVLSGGERQRAGLARLIVQDAPIWLLDEPTNHLDLKHQARLFHLLRQERSLGRSIVLVLHDLEQAARWADHLLLMAGGKLVTVGPPEAVLREDLLASAYEWPIRVSRDPQGGWHLAAAAA